MTDKNFFHTGRGVNEP